MRTSAETKYIETVVEKLSELRRALSEPLPTTNDSARKLFETLDGFKAILGNFNNDLSFVSTLLAKEWLQARFPKLEFDVATKAQGAPGLDIDLSLATGEKIAGEIKTTVPYLDKDFGAQQRKSILRDLEKLNASSAKYCFMFVTSQRAFEVLRNKGYLTGGSDILLINLMNGDEFSIRESNSSRVSSTNEKVRFRESATLRSSDIASQVIELVRSVPGLTERQLAERLFGSDAGYQQRVNQVCRKLVASNKVARAGLGGSNDPFAYHLVDS